MAETGAIEKRLGREAAALEIFNDLTASPNPYRGHAFQELAKYYEHRERDHALALEMTRNARNLEDSPELERREERLKRRLNAKPAPRKKKL
jgi:hypothetical protein